MMKSRVAVLVLLALAGCGGSDQREKSAAAKNAAMSPAAAAVESVAGVLQSTGTPVARLNFLLDTRPLVGVPAKLRLDVSSLEAAALLITAEADGLTLEADSARGTLVLTGGGTVTSRELAFTAQREGLIEIVVRLRKAEDGSVDTVYAIPVLIGPAPAASGG